MKQSQLQPEVSETSQWKPWNKFNHRLSKGLKARTRLTHIKKEKYSEDDPYWIKGLSLDKQFFSVLRNGAIGQYLQQHNLHKFPPIHNPSVPGHNFTFDSKTHIINRYRKHIYPKEKRQTKSSFQQYKLVQKTNESFIKRYEDFPRRLSNSPSRLKLKSPRKLEPLNMSADFPMNPVQMSRIQRPVQKKSSHSPQKIRRKFRTRNYKPKNKKKTLVEIPDSLSIAISTDFDN